MIEILTSPFGLLRMTGGKKSGRDELVNPKLIYHNVRAESLKLGTRGKIKIFFGSNGRINYQGEGTVICNLDKA
jgi:hypothetical protein